MWRLPATAISDSAAPAANACKQAAKRRTRERKTTRMPTVTRRDIAARLRTERLGAITTRGRGASVTDCVGMRGIVAAADPVRRSRRPQWLLPRLGDPCTFFNQRLRMYASV